MDNLIIIHKGQRVSKIIAGGMLIVFAVLLLIMNMDSLKLRDWLEAFLLTLVGILYATRLSGSDKSCIELYEGNIIILWRGWIKKVNIAEAEIESITLASNYVLINIKGKKAKRMDIHEMAKEQKKKVYEFLIEYAHQKNILMDRQ
jgi:hypothetical protein